jgi:hypothetical protein
VPGPPRRPQYAQRVDPEYEDEDEPTFSDCLRLVRSRIWQARISDRSDGKADVIELPRCYFEAIIQGLSAVA